jgi:hypothetical protein
MCVAGSGREIKDSTLLLSWTTHQKSQKIKIKSKSVHFESPASHLCFFTASVNINRRRSRLAAAAADEAIIFARCGDVIGTLHFYIHTGAGANKNKADDHKQNWSRTIFTATAQQQSSKVGVKKLKRSGV